MAGWFETWLKEKFAPAIEETLEQRLAEEARKLLNELLTNYTPAPEPPIAIGFKLLCMETGQMFMVIDQRQVMPGELHYCSGQIHSYPSILFPGHPHTCWIVVEIRPHQAPPPPLGRPPADRLARHLRTLGFKKAEQPKPEDVRARYLDLAKRYHPDLNPRGAEKMKRITEAYRSYQELMKCKTTTP